MRLRALPTPRRIFGGGSAVSTAPENYPLLVVDEVGYVPFEPEAANLFFQLVSSRYEGPA